jgi:hypothetical protein
MKVERIVCLANSYKHDHRCVAGISLATRRWLRLVGLRVPGCLTLEECCYADGTPAAPLDVIDIALGEPCGSNCHPEDTYIAPEPWQPVRRFDEPRDMRLLSACIGKRPCVLQGCRDRVTASWVEKKAVDQSLQLVRPEDLWWWIREETGKRRNRAVFRQNRTRYDLAVTDPVWLEKLRPLAPGIYPHAHFFSIEPPKTLLTVSLSEPFERFHYKLAAAVLTLPQ